MERESRDWTDAIIKLMSAIKTETEHTLNTINNDYQHIKSPPFNSTFRDLLLRYVQTSVSGVYDNFVVSLVFRKGFSEMDSTGASDWKQSTMYSTLSNVIPSQKRKYLKEIDANDQTFLIKRRREDVKVDDEVLSDVNEENTYLVSDDEDDVDDKSHMDSINSVAGTKDLIDKIATDAERKEGEKMSDQRADLSSTTDDNGHESTKQSPAVTSIKQTKATPNPNLIHNSTPFNLPKHSVVSILSSVYSSTPTSSRITSSNSSIPSPIPHSAPNPDSVAATVLGQATIAFPPIVSIPVSALAHVANKHTDTTPAKDLTSTKMSTRASVALNETNDTTLVETSTQNETTTNETSIQNNTSSNETLTKSSGKKIHACDECDYRTHRKDHLQRHQNTHKANPFHCQLCPKRFAAKEALDFHNTVHEQDKNTCEICNIKTATPFNLRRHMKNIHNK